MVDDNYSNYKPYNYDKEKNEKYLEKTQKQSGGKQSITKKSQQFEENIKSIDKFMNNKFLKEYFE